VIHPERFLNSDRADKISRPIAETKPAQSPACNSADDVKSLRHPFASVSASALSIVTAAREPRGPKIAVQPSAVPLLDRRLLADALKNSLLDGV
jgi:hypothetical protein